MHRTRLVVLTAVVGLGGAGLAVALTATTSGAFAPPSRLQIDSVGCTEGFHGHVHFGSCTYVLTDGRRFRCPSSFSKHRQTPTSIEHARACQPLKPIPIPPSWRPVLDRLYTVQACLARHGIRASGGPALENAQPRRIPLGELILIKARPTAFIAFYISARVARRAEPKVIGNTHRTGGVVHRRGLVTVVWVKPPARQLQAITEACAF